MKQQFLTCGNPHARAGLYLCGSGAHPGGGVMGAAGKNCARAILNNA
jgi:phytoene dehydrogenase-like protein